MINEKKCSIQLDSVNIKFSSWITDRNKVASNMIITVGSALMIADSLNATQSQTLIDLLEIHIKNIKQAELDAITFESKVAA